ncbi:MAG: hypothetical protein KAH38_00740, partial [Candidatus Hydrogenedentes bacterium]|nr:hypothetical protein [Candidatus Hydrogenedentota bacterium]
MVLVLLMLAILPTSVDITIAPDQPFPYVYVDDPLIIEFHSSDEIDIDIQLHIQASHMKENTEIALEKIHLHANSEYWYAVHNAPRDRGFYTIEIDMQTEEDTFTSQASFCRIDRPDSLHHLPIYTYCKGEEETCPFPAIRSIGIDTFRCDMDNPHFLKLATNASRFHANLIVAMTLDQVNNFSEEDVTLIQAQCEHIFRMDISPDNTKINDINIPDIMRKIGCPASISIVVPNVSAFEKHLLENPSLSARHATLMTFDWPELTELNNIKNIAAQQGQEGWKINILCPIWKPYDTGQTLRFIHKFFQYCTADISYIGLNANVLTDDTGVHEIMAYLNGLALRFHYNSYVGTLSSKENVQAPVFSDGASWFVALWSEQENKRISIPIGGAVSIELTDALGNILPLPEINDGFLKFTVGENPLYLTGNSGVILGEAALQEITVITKNILDNNLLTDQLPPAILDLVRNISESPQGKGSRLRFLKLLRVLPRLEEDWHLQKLPGEVACPAIMTLAKLARTLCSVEENRGEYFLEPLTDTTVRAAELQSLYLTGSAGTAQTRERGDWILGEVRRLIDESKNLDQAGRKIEGSAVAVLAEWRAHCLTYAAQAQSANEVPPKIQPVIAPELIKKTEDVP